jgi:hypothetical protein
MNIDVKKLLYKYPKLEVGLSNVRKSMILTLNQKQYPSCTPRYSTDIQGKGGLPMSQTERMAILNAEMSDDYQRLTWDEEEHVYALQLILTALQTLNDIQREVVRRTYFEDTKPVKVSQDMHISHSYYYHLHGLAITGIEDCLNGGNIFVNRLIPTKKNKNSENHSKNTGNQRLKIVV